MAEKDQSERPVSFDLAGKEAQSIAAPQTVTAPPASRGVLPFLVLLPLEQEARQLDRRTKWIITAIVSLSAAAAPLGSTILMPVLSTITTHFNTTRTVANLSVAFYSQAIAITPLWWSSISEASGRRVVYLVSFFLFVIFNILSAVSVSIGMFIVMRVLAGGAAASVQAVGAGTVADLWHPRERGHAMGIFFLGPMLGPLLSPIIGGAVSIKWGWRSTQWVMVIYGVIVWCLMLFFLPETSPSLKERNAETSTSRRSFFQTLAAVGSRIVAPLKLIPLLRFMPILITVYYASITFASYYLLNISIQTVFSSPPYSFSTLIVGLMYVPSSLGYILAALFGGKWTDRIMHRAAKKAGRYDAEGNIVLRPEDRIHENAWLAGIMYPAALLWYGWTVDKKIFWLVPCIANFFYGLGQMLIFNVTTTMLTEFLPHSSSTGVALNNLLRNTLACIACIVAEPLMQAIGNGWLFTGMSVICWASGLVLILMRRNAARWVDEMAQEFAKSR